MTLYFLIAAVVAYLFGSIPSAVWYGKKFHNIDVREHGSKNAGATNTFRVLGRKAGLIVFLLDLIKGALASLIPVILIQLELAPSNWRVEMQLVAGLIAIIGHIFPVFAGFKGGKGVATLTGMVLCIHPEAVGLCALVFLVVFLSTGYVSLGSISGAMAFPIFLISRVFGQPDSTLVIFGLVMFVAIVLTHKKNIRRLINGEENKIKLWR